MTIPEAGADDAVVGILAERIVGGIADPSSLDAVLGDCNLGLRIKGLVIGQGMISKLSRFRIIDCRSHFRGAQKILVVVLIVLGHRTHLGVEDPNVLSVGTNIKFQVTQIIGVKLLGLGPKTGVLLIKGVIKMLIVQSFGAIVICKHHHHRVTAGNDPGFNGGIRGGLHGNILGNATALCKGSQPGTSIF